MTGRMLSERLGGYVGMRICDSGLKRADFARELKVSEKTLNKILYGIDEEAFSQYIEALASQEIGIATDGASICQPAIGSKDDKAQLALLAV